MPKKGIVGVGFVGGALQRYFEEMRGSVRGNDLFLYDPAKGFSDDIGQADVVFLAVPTPPAADGSADTSLIESAIAGLGGGKVVVIKSTVPPGTTEAFQKKYPNHKILFSPEFLTEARAWENTIHPDRQLVGWTARSRDVAASVLALLPPAPLAAPSPEFDITATEAEIIKYASNVFLARKVTFANAIYDIASHHGANYENVRRGVSSDPRIGSSHFDVHHQGYRGYGGYCLPKDTQALVEHCRKNGIAGVAALLAADHSFNAAVLASQGLTHEDVSVHDHEWIQKKLKKRDGK